METVRTYEDRQTITVYGPAGLSRGDQMDLLADAKPHSAMSGRPCERPCILCHGPLVGRCLIRRAADVIVHEDCYQHYQGGVP